jgi:hypothetical protein
MAKAYSVGGDNLTLANQALTLVFINPKATVSPNLNILRMWAGQQASSSSVQQRVQAVTQVTAFPTLVSATPRSLKRSDTSASLITGATNGAAGTCGINASAEGAGAKTVMFGDVFSTVNGYLWVPTPDEIIELLTGDASGFGLYLPAAAPSLTAWACGINYREG